MKFKTFILSVILLLSVGSYAQTQKGKWVVSGNSGLSYNSLFAEGNSYSTINLNAGANYFVIDNFAIGLNASLLHQNNGREYATNYGIIPSVTYFFGRNQLRPFLSAGIGYMNFDDEGVLAYGGSGGFAYMIRDNISFNIALQYLRLSQGSEGINNLTTGLGFSIYF